MCCILNVYAAKIGIHISKCINTQCRFLYVSLCIYVFSCTNPIQFEIEPMISPYIICKVECLQPHCIYWDFNLFNASHEHISNIQFTVEPKSYNSSNNFVYVQAHMLMHRSILYIFLNHVLINDAIKSHQSKCCKSWRIQFKLFKWFKKKNSNIYVWSTHI